MPERGLAFSTEHARDFFLAGFTFDGVQPRKGAPMRYFFGHNEMSRSGRGNLRQMGNAQHLVATRQRAHLCSHRVGNFAPYIRVDLVEDEERDGILESESGFDRQHHTRNFAARSDRPQRLERLTRIRRKEQLERIRPTEARLVIRRKAGFEFGLAKT